MEITQCYLQITPYLPLPRKHSPDGASPDWGCGHLIAAYYSFINPKGWKTESAWLADLQRTVYPYKWSAVSRRSSAGQRKFACQRLTFYHYATPPTGSIYLLKFMKIVHVTSAFKKNTCRGHITTFSATQCYALCAAIADVWWMTVKFEYRVKTAKDMTTAAMECE